MYSPPLRRGAAGFSGERWGVRNGFWNLTRVISAQRFDLYACPPSEDVTCWLLLQGQWVIQAAGGRLINILSQLTCMFDGTVKPLDIYRMKLHPDWWTENTKCSLVKERNRAVVLSSGLQTKRKGSQESLLTSFDAQTTASFFHFRVTLPHWKYLENKVTPSLVKHLSFHGTEL